MERTELRAASQRFVRLISAALLVALVGVAVPCHAGNKRGEIVNIHSVPEEVTKVAHGITTGVNWIIAYKFEYQRPLYKLVGKDTKLRTVAANVFADGEALSVIKYIPYHEVTAAARSAIERAQPRFTPGNGELSTEAIGITDKKVNCYCIEGMLSGQTKVAITISPDGTDLRLRFPGTSLREVEFQKVTPKDGRFTAEMPGSPKESTTTIFGNMPLRQFEVEVLDNRVPFVIGELELSEQRSLGVAHPQEFLQILRNSFRESATIVEDREVYLGRVPGRDYVVETSVEDVYIRERMYLVGHRVYRLITTGTKEFLKLDEVNRFFDSFQLTQPAKPVDPTSLWIDPSWVPRSKYNPNSTSGSSFQVRVTSAEPTKEAALKVLEDLLAALTSNDFTKAASYIRIPPGAATVEVEAQAKALAKELTKEGISILASKGKWGTFEEMMGPYRANLKANLFQVPLAQCYGLSLGNAEAGFYWDGNKFLIIRCDDVGGH